MQNTIREEIKQKFGIISNEQFNLAINMATQDLNANNNGAFTVSEFLSVVCRSVQIIRERQIT